MTTKQSSDVEDFLQGLFGSAEPAQARVSNASAVATPTKTSESNAEADAGTDALEEASSSPIQRERRERPELTVGDVVLESAVGAGTLTSFTSRGVPRVNEVPAAWLKRNDGFVYDPMGRRRS